MSNALSPALLARLRKDEVEASKYLADGTIEDGLQQVKQGAERKLLALTHKAVDTLEEVMDYGRPGDRLAAAESILDRSPATKQMVAGQAQEAAIPVEALKSLMEGMSKMFGMAIEHQHTEIKRVQAEPEPVKLIAPKRRKK